MSKKTELSIRIEETKLDLFKTQTTKEEDTYLIMLPSILKGMGFHMSAHHSGEIHLKIKKPTEKTIKLERDKLEQMFLELLNEIIREPIDFSECLILYSNTKTNTKNLISSDKNIDISFIDLLKNISYLKTTSKKFLEDLLKLVEDKRLTGNENILVISTDRNELALYFPVKNEKIEELINNPLLVNKSNLLTKYHGLIITISSDIKNNEFIKVFREYFIDIENFFDDNKGIINTNSETTEFNLERSLKKLAESINFNEISGETKIK